MVDFFPLDHEAVAVQITSWALTCCASAGTAVSEGRSSYPVCTYHIPNTNLFIMKKKEICKHILDFLHSNTDCSENSQDFIRNWALIVDQLIYQSCTNQRNQLQKFILTTGTCFFKARTIISLSYMTIGLTMLWPFKQMFLKHQFYALIVFWNFLFM